MSRISIKAAVLKRWEAVRASFWFVPSLLAAAAVALAFVSLALDHGRVGEWVARNDLGYGGSAEGAATVLQTIATSMITIAGVVFSLTLVCLSLASTQFGPRLLSNFMRDAGNQIVLGTFIATFLYCILVLRSVRRADEDLFVPHLSVAIGVLLAVASLAVLVFFIHHVARSIQAEAQIARVAGELAEGIERLFPDPIGEGVEDEEEAALPEGVPGPVPAAEDGYIQIIDADALLELASEAGLVVHLARRPGDYVTRGEALAQARPRSRMDDELRERLSGCFAMGDGRTHAQDMAFTMQQLVEIALRALSPSMNDPFTAVACLDRIGSALRHLSQRRKPSPLRRDASGAVRVVAPGFDFAEIVALALDPIRRHGRDEPIVLARMAEVLASVAPCARRDADRRALRLQVRSLSTVVAALPKDDRAAAQRAVESAEAAVG